KRTLQAGEDFFNSATRGRGGVWKIARGEVYSEPFTVREGATMFDLARDLEGAKFMPPEEVLKAARAPTMVRDIAPHAHSLEGFLYPATYNLPRRPAANELAAQMVTRFKHEWSRITESAPSDKAMTADGKPMVSVVTLASLVERETPKPE